MKFFVEFYVMVRVENMEASMESNVTDMNYTKYVEIMYKYIHE